MEFTFTDEQKLLRETVRKFVDQELRPQAAAIDRNHEVPRAILTQMGALGLYGVSVPPEYGGAGMGEMGHCIVGEEVARGCASTSVVTGAHVALAITAILLDGTEAQKQKYLPPMVQGTWFGAFALTEAGAGSDAAAIETRAVRDGDAYVLTGGKMFITNGSFADVLVVFAVTDKALGAHGGVTAFLVEKGMKGFKVGKIDDKMGIRGSPTTELIFEEVRVPKENLLGQAGYGFLTAMKTLDRGRLSLAAGCLGGCKELLDVSAKYAIQRIQFGKPIAEHEAIQWMLAEMEREVYLCESIVYRTAWMADQGMRFSHESAIAKLHVSEALNRSADLAVQLHGGYGYIAEFPIERMYRDARIHRIFEGTNEIQRLIIARDVLKAHGYDLKLKVG